MFGTTQPPARLAEVSQPASLAAGGATPAALQSRRHGQACAPSLGRWGWAAGTSPHHQWTSACPAPAQYSSAVQQWQLDQSKHCWCESSLSINVSVSNTFFGRQRCSELFKRLQENANVRHRTILPTNPFAASPCLPSCPHPRSPAGQRVSGQLQISTATARPAAASWLLLLLLVRRTRLPLHPTPDCRLQQVRQASRRDGAQANNALLPSRSTHLLGRPERPRRIPGRCRRRGAL